MGTGIRERKTEVIVKDRERPNAYNGMIRVNNGDIHVNIIMYGTYMYECMHV